MARRARARLTIAGLAVLAAGSVLGPGTATAACQAWDVSGRWTVVQSNGFQTHISLQQSGNELRGTAKYATRPTSGRFGAADSGQVDGSIRGNSINFTIFWTGNSVGVYSGKVSQTGRIEGSTHDKRSPASKAAWHSSARMRCR